MTQEQDLKLKNLMDRAYTLAKEFDAFHTEQTGPFAQIPDGYDSVPLIDRADFSDEAITQLITNMEIRATKEDMGQAGKTFLKMFLTLAFYGIKLAN